MRRSSEENREMNVVVIMVGIAIALGLILARCMDWVDTNAREMEEDAPVRADWED